MPRTPDEFPGERIDESVLFISGTFVPAQNGEMAYVSGSGFKFYEEGVVKSLGGLSIFEHENLNSLAHDPALNSFDDILYDNVGLLTMSIWTDSTRTQLLQHYNVVRLPNRLVQSVTSSAYFSGSLNARLIETVTYDSRKRITSITRSRVL